MWRRWLRDRCGATALILAMLSVPMLIAAGTAVDFSRIAAARAQLQFAVDAAALAGAGAFQTNQDGTAAYNIAKTAFNASAATLGGYAVVTSTVGTLCNAAGKSNVTCGTSSGSNGSSALCPGTTIYCVEVTAQATLTNSLLAFVIPSDVLNTVSVAQSTGTNSIGIGNFSHIGVGYGSDLSAIYAYAVPTDAAGNAEYDNAPAPNVNCASSSYGPIHYLPLVAAGSGASNCNFVLIGENSGGSGTGNIDFAASDPVAFSFVNFTGGTITAGNGPADLDTTSFNAATGVSTNTASATHYTNEIYVTITQQGTVIVNNYFANGDTVNGVTLYGTCPAHNLYGSITAYPDSSAADDIVPYQDSLNVYSTAWEILGYPPTHSTNHALLPFLGPAVASVQGQENITVRAICPQWPTTGTQIGATAAFSPSNLPAGYSPVGNAAGNLPTATNVPVYSTYYPDANYADASGTYPPEIGGCTPATAAADGGVTPASDDPWWGWSPPNANAGDPGGAGENPGGSAVTNCTAAVLNSGGTAIVTTRNSLQSSLYDNCAFLIQPLGTDVPSSNGIPNLPDYWTYSVTPGAFAAGMTGNPANIVDSPGAPVYGMAPFYDGSGNAGYLPTQIAISGTGTFTVTEPPAYGRDHYPPEDTSHRCYNPQANGIDGSLLPGVDQPNNDTHPLTPIDPVENPEFGAVLCNSNPPPSFALFWNDMGAWAKPPRYNDDLGYSNAVTEFTCPTPGTPGSTGPPALIY